MKTYSRVLSAAFIVIAWNGTAAAQHTYSKADPVLAIGRLIDWRSQWGVDEIDRANAGHAG
jgi:hypothetical protein